MHEECASDHEQETEDVGELWWPPAEVRRKPDSSTSANPWRVSDDDVGYIVFLSWGTL